jgi:hypothetical protein
MPNEIEKPGETVATDVLRGAREIAGELGVTESEVYYFAKTKRYPIARLGKTLIASRKQLRRAHRNLTAAS